MAETTPATPMTHCTAVVAMVPGSAHWALTQSALKFAPRATRMVFKMTFASITMARPMKACERVFFAVMTLPGSPSEKV